MALDTMGTALRTQLSAWILGLENEKEEGEA